VSDNALQKSVPSSVKEKGQYVLVLGVIASMLVVAQIPIFVVFFFGVFGYLVLKMLATSSKSDTREIFEFYLSANEILRDDERKWFGFEIGDAITRGEGIVRRMSAAPPLVQFALGALYNKSGDHKAAVKYLTNVLERDGGDEGSFVYPTPELRNYVKVLRKIEREPADAPMTSAAIRSLERTRRLRGKTLLEDSRVKFANGIPNTAKAEITEASDGRDYVEKIEPVAYPESNAPTERSFFDSSEDTLSRAVSETKNPRKKRSPEDAYADRKPITEVLHDIYDKNIQ
jgi:hypothetical protein